MGKGKNTGFNVDNLDLDYGAVLVSIRGKTRALLVNRDDFKDIVNLLFIRNKDRLFVSDTDLDAITLQKLQKTKTWDIEGFAEEAELSECCSAPIHNGRCFDCKENVK